MGANTIATDTIAIESTIREYEISFGIDEVFCKIVVIRKDVSTECAVSEPPGAEEGGLVRCVLMFFFALFLVLILLLVYR